LNRPNGVSTTYNFDSLSRLASVLHKAGTTTLNGAGYGYDNAGNRTSKTNYLNNITENYTYGPLYQLTQVTQGLTTTESYAYDPVGNRLSSLGMSPYAYNSSNELTSTPSAAFTYDNNGNTASKADANGTTGYTWDFENRLSAVTLPGTSGTVLFKYDPFGRRIQKSSASGTTNYLYEGSNTIAELDGSGNLVARYTQGAGIDEPLAQLRSGAVDYYDQDGLGSVTTLAGTTGTIGNSYTYDSFGNLVASTGSAANPFQYTGRDFDSETGLRYYRARYYDPEAGRFLSEDPGTFYSGANFYAYVGNDPQDLIDPTGFQQRTPAKGPPNGTQFFPDGKGGGTDRQYGPSGDATKDIDYGHDHGAGDPHAHDWDWSKTPPRGPGRTLRPDEIPSKCPPSKTPPSDELPWWQWPLKWIPRIPRIPGPTPVMFDPCLFPGMRKILPSCGGGNNWTEVLPAKSTDENTRSLAASAFSKILGVDNPKNFDFLAERTELRSVNQERDEIR
jgi:RHS repeat-associated protein